MKRLALIFVTAALLFGLSGCAKPRNPYENIEQNPIATITLTDGKTMMLELYPKLAPNTVANFVKLANGGFYDGLQVFRVASDVLIQAGDPNNNGTGGADYYIKGEFDANGVRNTISHMRGTISMARKTNYNTASSQFFIMEGSYPEYDGKYAAFGRIMDDQSLATLDDIGSRPVDGNYVPLDRIYIKTIRVETFGVEYEPETLKKEDVDPKPKDEQ